MKSWLGVRVLACVRALVPPRRVGDLAEWLGSRLRAHAKARARMAKVLPHRSHARREADGRAMWRGLARALLEAQDLAGATITLRAQASGLRALCGIHARVVATLHLGPWESLPAVSIWYGLDTNTLVRADANAQAVRRWRAKAAPRIGTIQRDSAGMRALLAATRDQTLTALLFDLHAKAPRGRWLGLPAALGVNALGMFMRAGARVVPAFAVRARQGARIVLAAPLAVLPREATKAASNAALLARLAPLGEAAIRAHAADYLWTYNPWRFGKNPRAFGC